VNKALLLGRLGQDPDVKHTPAGNKVLSISLATSMRYKDKSGEKQEKTEWHRLVIWNRLAEIVGEYCKKGSQLFVEGRLETRKWQDEQGKDRYVTEVLVERLELCGSVSNRGGVPAPGDDNHMEMDFDDDIPF